MRPCRSRRLCLLAAAIVLALPATARAASASVTGTWVLVRADNLAPDGTRTALYGPRPAGLLIFGADGRYEVQIAAPGRPKFASGDKAKGTAEEYRAASVGYNAHFGSYAVDPAAHTLTFRIEQASFPNWEGAVQVRRFTLSGDRLTYVVPAPTSGAGAVGEVEWRRADAEH